MRCPPKAQLAAALLASRPNIDIELVGRAYDVAAQRHQGQLRRSGDPYITHPIAVAKMLARLRTTDDQMLCAAILHDTVEDTPYTLAELRRDFGLGIAAMVAELTALDRLRYSHGEVTKTLVSIQSADSRVVTLKVFDRLHNMQTLEFLTQAKQLRKAREVLDIFLPVAQQLGLRTVRSELQSLACGALIRNRPALPPQRRVIIGLDIEQSTSRPDLVKAELRVMLYELFEAALRAADIGPYRRGPFMDRGDGLLVLVDPAEQPALLSCVIPVFGQLLVGYNASVPAQRQFRVRLVVHAGEVRDDDNGSFGTALDVACRLLDAPEAKAALRAAPGSLLVVISGEIYRSITAGGHDAFRRLLAVRVAGHNHPGWVSSAA